MKEEETPCTRLELLTTLLGGVAEAGASVVSGYTEPFYAAAAAAKAGLPRSIKPAGPTTAVPVRPPGAVTESRFLKLCSRCGDCVRACPALVIRKAGPELGATLEGSPILRPAEAPCLFCKGFPCASACGNGALIPPRFADSPRIGLAVVDAALCYAGQGQPCDLCVQKCPVSPRGVSVGQGRAALTETAACNGCGLCAQSCPAAAITIEAMR